MCKRISPSCLSVVAALFLSLHVSQGDERRETAKPIVVVPVLRTTPYILVPVTIGEESYSFVIDTGSSRVAFDRSLQKHLGAATSTVTVRTPAKRQMMRHPPVECKIGEHTFKTANWCMCGDLSNLRRFGIDGILGISFLADYTMVIDYDAGFLSLYRPGDLPADLTNVELPFDTTGLQRHTIQVNHDLQPLIACRVGTDWEGIFMIDTGSTTTCSIDVSDFADLRRSRALGETHHCARTLTISGTYQAERARARTFGLGKFTNSDVVVHSGPYSTLGLGYLRRYNIVFDFNNWNIWLAKSRSHNLHDAKGIDFDANGSISNIVPNSLADRAGLKRGDKVIKFDGADVTSRVDDLSIAIDTLSQMSKRAELVVSRAEKQVVVKLPRSNQRAEQK